MSKNKKIFIDNASPFVLADSGNLWMVVAGEVNVFYTQIGDDGKYLSALKYLFTAKKSDLLFSLLPRECTEKTRLIAFSDGASLLTLKKYELVDIDYIFLKKMTNNWISRMTGTLNRNNAPRVYTPLDDFNHIILSKGEVAYPSNGIHWASLIKGELNIFCGNKVISANDDLQYPIPVSKNLWISSLTNKTEISIKSTREVLEDDINFLLALEKLESHFFYLLNQNFYKDEEDSRLQIEEKANQEKSQMETTLNIIKNVVESAENDFPIKNAGRENGNNSILFQTCELIGRHANFKIKEPRYFDTFQHNISNQLNAIVKSSKIRVRKIILRGTWWKEENGHLLAFLKEDRTPVALIQKNSTSYLLKNLLTGSESKINFEIAQNIEPIGYMFFAGFERKVTSIKQVFGFAVKGHKKDMRFLISAALIGSLVGLLIPILSGIMFDDVIPTADRAFHFEIFAIMIITGLVIAGLQLAQGVLQLRMESKSSVNLQASVMDYILRLPVTFYKNYSAGDLTNRVLSINAIRQVLSNTFMTAALSGAFSLVNLVLLFYYDSKLAWIGILLGGVAAGAMITIGLFKLKYDRQISDDEGKIQGFLFEFLSGISKIRITGGEQRVFTLWAQKFSKLNRLSYISGRIENVASTVTGSYPLLTSIVFFSVIYFTILNADGKTAMLSVGAFMAFITAFNKFLDDSLRLSMAFISSLNIVPLYERVKPILEAEPESVEQSSDPGELSGDIEMNSVSFKYHQDQPLVLECIDFKIRQGEMVAFVGASGSGKSTIMRLLLGFEHPASGSIFYDDEAFELMNKELVRRQIGVVLQNGALMSGSIYENIVGNSELTLDDAWNAARMAGMEDDIKQMPMGMHTVISEGAGTFSGGQRQRLMIARAIVHKPRLLFMDEATSALDNRTQKIVSESLDKLQATRIVIAHRLSTVKNADKIYVLDKGRIIESGTYDDLMKLNGAFTQLAKRQIA